MRLSRIQAVHYEQSLLRRWVNLATINVLLASSGRGDKEKQDKTTIIPVVSSSKAYHVLSDFLPSYRLITPKRLLVLTMLCFMSYVMRCS
ncbi:PH domain-containing protein [Leuconostoc citreum]